MTEEQLNNWFTYHPPTSETAPKYAAIRYAENECLLEFDNIVTGSMGIDPFDCDRVNVVTRQFASIINSNCPESADKTAAIRCVRLARNSMNEWIMSRNALIAPISLANTQLAMARWQACSAIACDGK